jgi:catechol 2,3-dioxygenase-like lactoylglutathione lyase family enzyme
MGEVMAFDHIHLISRDPKAAADWYKEMFGGEIAEVQPNLRGAPQIDVRVGGMTIVIRGQRPGEQPADTQPMRHFDGYSSHDKWGTDHFGFLYQGDLTALCADLRKKGVSFPVELKKGVGGSLLCYVAAPDGVSIELMQC